MSTYPTQDDIDAVGGWFQGVTFPNGLEAGHHPAIPMIRELLDRFSPEGLDCLDIGCNCGVMCAEMERSGARYVSGIDLSERHIARQELTRKAFGLQRTRFAQRSIYSLGDFADDEVDLVAFCGVYYHLWHPLLGLEKAWACCRKAMLVEGAIDEGDEPTMRFCLTVSPFAPNDPTNWWYPTMSCMSQMIEALGGVKNIECFQRDFDGPRRALWIVERDQTVPMVPSAERSC